MLLQIVCILAIAQVEPATDPTVGDPTTFAEAAAIVARVQGVPASVRAYLERGTRCRAARA